MKNTQKENKDKTEQTPTISPVGARELLAMELRFEGYTSKDIAKKISMIGDPEKPIKDFTVRTWFMTGGKLHELYADYVETESKKRFKTADDMFGAHLANAVRVLVQIMGDGNAKGNDRIKAAIEVINRIMGEPVKRLQETGKQSVLDEYFEKLKQHRK